MRDNSKKDLFEKILNEWTQSFCSSLGTVKSIVRFGSTTRPPLKQDTDIDLFIVLNHLPQNRRERFKFIEPFEIALIDKLKQHFPDHNFSFSPILRTPEDLEVFSPLYLDMVEHSVMHYDTEKVMQKVLDRTAQWIKKSGAKKINQGLKWYWDLNPNRSLTKIDW